MKRILLVALLSYCAAYYYLDKHYWQKINPDNFVKSEADARDIIESKVIHDEVSERRDEEVKQADRHHSDQPMSFLSE